MARSSGRLAQLGTGVAVGAGVGVAVVVGTAVAVAVLSVVGVPVTAEQAAAKTARHKMHSSLRSNLKRYFSLIVFEGSLVRRGLNSVLKRPIRSHAVGLRVPAGR